MVMTIKYHLLNYLYKFVLVTVIVAVIIIELVRLYLGYLGNLTEKVPELAGFWLLTILLQLPLQGFLLLNTDLILVPIGKPHGLLRSEMIERNIKLKSRGYFWSSSIRCTNPEIEKIWNSAKRTFLRFLSLISWTLSIVVSTSLIQRHQNLQLCWSDGWLNWR